MAKLHRLSPEDRRALIPPEILHDSLGAENNDTPTDEPQIDRETELQELVDSDEEPGAAEPPMDAQQEDLGLGLHDDVEDWRPPSMDVEPPESHEFSRMENLYSLVTNNTEFSTVDLPKLQLILSIAAHVDAVNGFTPLPVPPPNQTATEALMASARFRQLEEAVAVSVQSVESLRETVLALCHKLDAVLGKPGAMGHQTHMEHPSHFAPLRS